MANFNWFSVQTAHLQQAKRQHEKIVLSNQIFYFWKTEDEKTRKLRRIVINAWSCKFWKMLSFLKVLQVLQESLLNLTSDLLLLLASLTRWDLILQVFQTQIITFRNFSRATFSSLRKSFIISKFWYWKPWQNWSRDIEAREKMKREGLR